MLSLSSYQSCSLFKEVIFFSFHRQMEFVYERLNFFQEFVRSVLPLTKFVVELLVHLLLTKHALEMLIRPQ